ncbi:Hypothetical predicted protein [Xyrichtys novacula]|uniref:Uncharacterized protein n=1 Tax=Xyrichtys novacula TaxID=13765 RepID=A0AAV1HCH1_XYRNO|nr:Hypothetical predicted protein [Xyrichtys novacula]
MGALYDPPARTTHLAVPASSSRPEIIRERFFRSLADQLGIHAADHLLRIEIMMS